MLIALIFVWFVQIERKRPIFLRLRKLSFTHSKVFHIRRNFQTRKKLQILSNKLNKRFCNNGCVASQEIILQNANAISAVFCATMAEFHKGTYLKIYFARWISVHEKLEKEYKIDKTKEKREKNAIWRARNRELYNEVLFKF